MFDVLSRSHVLPVLSVGSLTLGGACGQPGELIQPETLQDSAELACDWLFQCYESESIMLFMNEENCVATNFLPMLEYLVDYYSAQGEMCGEAALEYYICKGAIYSVPDCDKDIRRCESSRDRFDIFCIMDDERP